MSDGLRARLMARRSGLRIADLLRAGPRALAYVKSMSRRGDFPRSDLRRSSSKDSTTPAPPAPSRVRDLSGLGSRTEHREFHQGRPTLIAATILSLAAGAFAATPDELLKLADRPKSEFREAVIHARITVTQNGKSESPAEFELYKKGDDRGLVVFTAGKQKGRKILTVGDKFWLIVPGSSHAISVTPNQRLMGGASLADVSKLRFSEEFTATVAGPPEMVEGRPCDVLKLTPRSTHTSYGGGTLWIDRAEHLARKAVLSLVSGKPAKEIAFDRYGKQDGKTVLASMTIRDLLGGPSAGTTSIDYTNYRVARIDDKLLTPEGALDF